MVARWTIAQDCRSRTPVTWCCAATVTGLPSGGHGLTGLRERAAHPGGTMGAGPQADGGFLVRVRLLVAAVRV